MRITQSIYLHQSSSPGPFTVNSFYVYKCEYCVMEYQLKMCFHWHPIGTTIFTSGCHGLCSNQALRTKLSLASLSKPVWMHAPTQQAVWRSSMCVRALGCSPNANWKVLESPKQATLVRAVLAHACVTTKVYRQQGIVNYLESFCFDINMGVWLSKICHCVKLL